MSLRNNLFSSIDDTISKFIGVVSIKYNISKEDLENIWSSQLTNIEVSSKQEVKTIENTETVKPKDSNRPELEKMKVSELKALCKAKGIKSGGKKNDIIDRIVKFDSGETDEKDVSKESKKKDSKKTKSSIINFLTKSKEKIIIDVNEHGNQEHKETGFVFVNEIVIGVQMEDGKVRDLTEDDIDKCNCYKFEYRLPENLNKKIIETDLLSEEESDIEVEEDSEEEVEVEEEVDVEVEVEEEEEEDSEEEIEDSDEEIIIEDSDEE